MFFVFFCDFFCILSSPGFYFRGGFCFFFSGLFLLFIRGGGTVHQRAQPSGLFGGGPTNTPQTAETRAFSGGKNRFSLGGGKRGGGRWPYFLGQKFQNLLFFCNLTGGGYPYLLPFFLVFFLLPFVSPLVIFFFPLPLFSGVCCFEGERVYRVFLRLSVLKSFFFGNWGAIRPPGPPTQTFCFFFFPTGKKSFFTGGGPIWPVDPPGLGPSGKVGGVWGVQVDGGSSGVCFGGTDKIKKINIRTKKV